MIGVGRRGWRVLLVAAALGLPGADRACRAQDEDEEPAQAAGPRQGFVLNANQFNQWVFNNRGETPTANRFESVLQLRVDEVDRACRLTDTQKAKLRLAGRGDVTRFFDKVEAKRRELQDKEYDQNQINEVFQKIAPIREVFNVGLFEDGSLFAKTLAALLDTGQADRLAAATRERLEFRYRAKVDLAVASVGRSMGLTGEQRRKFTEVLMAETRSPRSFGQHESYVVMLQASRLPEAKLKTLFDDAQWRVLQRQLQQARQIEQAIVRGGYVPAEGTPEDGAADEASKKDD